MLQIFRCLSFIYMFLFVSTQLLAQKTVKNQDLIIVNFDKQGNQVIRYNSVGDAIDAHDGEIALFGGTYYLYGTSYDCGFEWGNKNAPFCGFKVYSSKDMRTWTDKGYLFDAKTEVWQTRCNGNTYGCFRPHVIFNNKTKLYVLWINVYDNVSGYRVFTSKTPIGPFNEVAEPKLAVNANMPAGGLNNGDHDTFVDDNGTAYLAYTDWRTKGTIVIEKLSSDYLTGTGEVVKGVTDGNTEAPGMFKRNGIYYVVYSDPNCGYCSGTGASYKTSGSPLGPWSAAKRISNNSCGGQPSFVSTIKLDSGNLYLFGSDLWNNAAKNEALANYYWAPLRFNSDGSIIPMTCDQPFKVNKNSKVVRISAVDEPNNVKDSCNIKGEIKRSQSFVSGTSGVLKSISLPLYKTGSTDAALQIDIYKADDKMQPTGVSLASSKIPAKSIGWSIKKQTVHPGIRIKKGTVYCIVLHSLTTTGCYGCTYNKSIKKDAKKVFSQINGSVITQENSRELNFSLAINPAGTKP